MTGRGLLEARRASAQDSTRPSDRLAIGSALLGGLLVGAVVIVRTAMPGQGTSNSASNQARRAQAGYVATTRPEVAGASTARPPTVVAKPAAAAAPAASQSRQQVAHTDGAGVVLRASPRDDDKVPAGFMDGDWVTVLDHNGQDWALVQGDSGLQGWVPTRYLSP